VGDVATDPLEETLASRLGLAGERLLEWRWGRAAARELFEPGVWIDRADDGTPLVRGAPGLVTISHTRTWAAAAAGDVSALGIDVCDHTDASRVRRVLPRFGGTDQALLEGASDRDFCCFWAIKEAAAKALNIGLLDGGLKATRLLSLTELEGDLSVHVEDWADAVSALVWR
jgi:phosphopantetheinyl transferase